MGESGHLQEAAVVFEPDISTHPNGREASVKHGLSSQTSSMVYQKGLIAVRGAHVD